MNVVDRDVGITSPDTGARGGLEKEKINHLPHTPTYQINCENTQTERSHRASVVAPFLVPSVFTASWVHDLVPEALAI